MKAYIVNHFSDDETKFGTALISGELVSQGDKYYFRRASNGLILSMNPPSGAITWASSPGPYELADLTAKGLVYTPEAPGYPVVPYLVQVVQ